MHNRPGANFRLSLSVLCVLATAGVVSCGDCPVCISGDVACDVVAVDSADAAVPDSATVDVTDDSGQAADAGDVDGDMGGDADVVTDAAVDDDIADADNDADSFFTGHARIIGRAFFTNLGDHSGFEITLSQYGDEGYVNEGAPRATILTGSDGKFEFNRVPTGLYEIVVWHGPLTQEYFRRVTVDAIPGETTDIGDQSFTAMGNITGTVVNPDGSPQGSGIAYTAGRTKWTDLRGNGTFSFGSLMPGTYDICIGLYNVGGACVGPVEVVGLETAALGEITVAEWFPLNGPGVNITGNVTLFGKSDHSGINVIYAPGPWQVIATTDAAGNYSFDNVTPGPAEIRFVPPAGSGYEDDPPSMEYNFFSGTSEVLPPQVLLRGRTVWSGKETGSYVGDGLFTPDSGKVVISTHIQPADASGESYFPTLYSFDPATGELIWLADGTGGVEAITPDSETVIFSHDYGSHLFSTPVTGGMTRLLTTRGTEGAAVSPDSRFAIYTAWWAQGMHALFASEIATGYEHRLCAGRLHSISDDSRDVFCWDGYGDPLEIVRLADGAQVYAADDVAQFVTDADRRTVFACMTDGSGEFVNVDTGATLPLDDKVGNCSANVMTPDSGTLVYRSADGMLMAASAADGAPLVLDDGNAQPLVATPDSERVIYMRSDDDEVSVSVYVTDVDGNSEPTLLFADLRGSLQYPDVTPPAPGNFRVDADGTGLFAALAPPGSQSLELHHMTLDGTRDTFFGNICNNNCGRAPTWLVDEPRSLVYMHLPFGKVVVADMTTGQALRMSDMGLGFGLIAPDLSGSLSMSYDMDALVWLSFPDLEYTLLKPKTMVGLLPFDEPDDDVVISPDGSKVIFESTFGAGGYSQAGGPTRRVILVDLDALKTP